jgi:hypothetical protein
LTVSLPVDPERLRAEFPEVSSEELEAYVTVTGSVLAASGTERPRLLRAILEGGLKAREKEAQGASLTEEERLWLRYRAAVDKMQRSTARR